MKFSSTFKDSRNFLGRQMFQNFGTNDENYNLCLIYFRDADPVVRHENFRLFACMNPATDVGKKDLPAGVRNRFTELYVDELQDVADLKILVAEYLKGLSLTAGQVEGIVKFYLNIRQEALKKLTDGTGHKPHYR